MTAAPWDSMPLGRKQAIELPVCVRADGTVVVLRLLVVRGSSPGPTLLLLGAVHGDEYEGPAAIWESYQTLEPADLSGTVVMLPVTNPPAYAAGLRVNPDDPKDLARTFPGSPTGSITERIAWQVHHDLIAHADFLCDLHSAGRLYRIEPWVGYGLVEDPNLLERQRAAAGVVGYPTVWGTPLLPGRTLASAAELGVPAIYLEAPGEGRALPADVERNRLAIRQLLRLLKMVPEPLAAFQPERVIEDDRPHAGFLQIQLVAGAGGFFAPKVAVGATVTAGEPFGQILDPAGGTLDEPRCPCSGRVVFLRTFPIVQAGDSLGTILER